MTNLMSDTDYKSAHLFSLPKLAEADRCPNTTTDGPEPHITQCKLAAGHAAKGEPLCDDGVLTWDASVRYDRCAACNGKGWIKHDVSPASVYRSSDGQCQS